MCIRDSRYIVQMLQLFSQVKCSAYYARMGLAWAVSVCYVKFPGQTRAFLGQNQLDAWTQNKAIQKIRESLRAVSYTHLCGLFLGWKLSLVALFLAVVTGGFYGIYLLAAGKKGRKEHFAFGPFLCAGMFLAYFWGTPLLDWYLGLLALN